MLATAMSRMKSKMSLVAASVVDCIPTHRQEQMAVGRRTDDCLSGAIDCRNRHCGFEVNAAIQEHRDMVEEYRTVHFTTDLDAFVEKS
jgi:hypothetical protein